MSTQQDTIKKIRELCIEHNAWVNEFQKECCQNIVKGNWTSVEPCIMVVESVREKFYIKLKALADLL